MIIDSQLKSVINLPEWLTDPSLPVITKDTISPSKRKLLDIQYSSMFESVLDRVTLGESLDDILYKDSRDFDKADFLRWIFRNSDRKSQYYEALAIFAELETSRVSKIAEGKEDLEDIKRSTLRIETIKYKASIANRKRFGDVKQLEHTGSISITQALADARNRVIEASFEEL